MLDGQEPVKGDAVEPIITEYTNSHIARIQEEGYRLGVPNIMNYTMDRRLIECLHRGLPLDIDVYDAAEWSCIAELSERSVQNGGIPVKIPDFTRAKW